MEVFNQTQCVHETTMGLDIAGREHLSVVFRGTWDFPEGDRGVPTLAQDQAPLVMADQYTGDPGFSATQWETDFAFRKPHPEIIVQGAAYAPNGQKADRVRVGVRVDDWLKQFDVVGYREWQAAGPLIRPSRPVPFQKMPISYDTAFGGADQFDSEDETAAAFAQNPVGRGFASPKYQDKINGLALPNTEAVGAPISSPYDEYTPMALGPIGRAWPARAQFAGTYDQDYIDTIFPFLPPDFDERYFQSAPSDQWVKTLRSGAQVVIVGMTPSGRVTFALPQTNVPITLFERGEICLQTDIQADTLLIDTEARQFSLIWRLEYRMRRTILDFDKLWLGPPTEPMLRAHHEGRVYVRTPAIATDSEDAA